MIRPLNTPFTDWCGEKLLEAEHIALQRVPAELYWTELDAGHDALDRLDAALGRKVVVNAA